MIVEHLVNLESPVGSSACAKNWRGINCDFVHLNVRNA